MSPHPRARARRHLCDALRQTPDFVYSVSCTTRPPRAGEIEGEDYHFLSESDFIARVKAGEFLEHAKVHEHYYGTLRKPLVANLQNGVDVLIDVDIQGAAAIRASDDQAIRQALCDVFIMPPDLDELRRRLTKRGTETAQQIELRIATAARKWRFGATIATRSSANRWRKICKNFATSWAQNAI